MSAIGILACATAPERAAVLGDGVAGTARPGTQLERGMLLIYASDGRLQPPWSIDSLQLSAPLLMGAECAIIYLRRSPEPEPEERRLCVARDTLYQWEAGGGGWTISRPVGPAMVWSARRANGDVVRYETGSVVEESVSDRSIPVVLTTITTTDSLGRPKRRLRERYAVVLATATGGTFESPDSSGPGGWRAASTFELREIRAPARARRSALD